MTDTTGPQQVVEREAWDSKQKTGWWVKFGAIIGPVIAIMSLMTMCGGVKLLGALPLEDAERSFKEAEARDLEHDRKLHDLEQTDKATFQELQGISDDIKVVKCMILAKSSKARERCMLKEK